MKLKCSVCNHVYIDAPEGAENITSNLEDERGWWCEGTLIQLFGPNLPMVGDPPEASPLSRGFYDPTLDRKKLLYKHLMQLKGAKQPAKTGIVPKSLRRGLWAHIW